MSETRDIMGMPITITLARGNAAALERAFAYFTDVDERFSTYKEGSEISRFNRGEMGESELSGDMREVFALAERTKEETNGYFDMKRPDGSLDPSGIVKGWAVRNAAALLESEGIADYCIDAGGDIASAGTNAEGKPWSVGIRNPFDRAELVKVIYPRGKGVATSGSYVRGAHIYDPHAPSRQLDSVVSITVVGSDVLEADRYATAAFAMGPEGIAFIDATEGLEGYSIDKDGIATMTAGFLSYTSP